MASGLLSIEEAQRIVLEQIAPMGTERVDLLSALGRVLAEDIHSPTDVPPFANSAMDGYAVRAVDTLSATPTQPVVLKVLEDLPAGYVSKTTVGSGQAIRIMTGAPIPEGADAVVMVEATERTENGNVKVYKPAKPGQHVRPCAEDVRQGDLLVGVGTRLDAASIGVLASAQRPYLRVFRRPIVAIISTGDELVEIEEPLTAGRIVNSNSYSLAALVREAGGVPVVQPIARDSETQIRTAIESALTADFVVSSGGVSVGDYDYVKQVLNSLGAVMHFWRVSMKPGKPVAFGLLRNRPYFGLPGNTVSSMLSFLFFVRPAICKALGCKPPYTLPEIDVVLDSELRSKGDRKTFLRAQLYLCDGRFHASLMPHQGSGVLSSMLGAHALVIADEGVTFMPKGTLARALVISNPF